MKTRSRIRALLALSTLTSLASAQQASKPATPATTSGHTPDIVDKAAPKMEPIFLHVSGLTKDNQSQAKEALTGMGRQHYVCPACKHQQTLPGKCPLCKTELRSEKREAFSNVMLSPDASSITVTPAAGALVRLSEIESALARNSVHVDENRLALSGRAILVLRESAPDQAAPVEKALKDAKLFDDVHARFDSILHELDVDVRAGATGPQRSAVAKAVESSGTKARLYDVIWGQVPYKT